MKMTRAIVKYIKEQNVDCQKLSEQTGIAQERLQKISDVPFSAEELLCVCQTLKLKPEELWKTL